MAEKIPPLQDFERLLRVGVAHHQAGRHVEAEAAYRQILGIRSDHRETLHLLGLLYLQTGQLPEAESYLAQAMQSGPPIAEEHYNLGLTLVGQGRVVEAAQQFRRAVELRPDFAAARNNLGNALRELGDLKGAAHQYRYGLELDPANAALHNNLGVVLHNRGNNDEAVQHYRRAIALDSTDADTHFNLGNALCALGYWEQSIAAYERAIGLKPDLVDAYVRLATALRQLNRFEEAEAYYRHVLGLRPDLTAVYVDLGAVLEEQGRLQEAERVLKRAIELGGRSGRALMGLGNLHKAYGRFREAEASYREALCSSSDYVYPYGYLVTLKRYSSRDDEDAQRIRALLTDPNIEDEGKVCLQFALGKILDDCGAYDDAFSHYDEGNALNYRTSHFEVSELVSYVDRVVSTFDTEFFASRSEHGSSSELPVFVVGMPRSGTTLVEQIIAGHPQVHGAGELNKIHDLAREIDTRYGPTKAYPEAVTEIDPETSRALSAEYETHLRTYADPGAVRISDKMPFNFMHLGLIALLFPNARVIHCMRHPLDVGLSIYFQQFRHSHQYADNLANIGRFYRLYERLMKHWGQVLSLKGHHLRYEDLVTDPERETRALIEFLGLPWDDRCLVFHRNEHPVQTASAWQVRRPVYSHAVGRWRNYEKYLGALKKTLGIET